MSQRVWRRYSLAFRSRVVSELESGRFSSVQAARRHYQIGGAATICGWVRRMGKNHLLAKVVRVETQDERDQVAELRKQVARLQSALGQTQAENLLNQSYLKLACEQLGQDPETFRKKCDGGPSMPPVKRE